MGGGGDTLVGRGDAIPDGDGPIYVSTKQYHVLRASRCEIWVDNVYLGVLMHGMLFPGAVFCFELIQLGLDANACSVCLLRAFVRSARQASLAGHKGCRRGYCFVKHGRNRRAICKSQARPTPPRSTRSLDARLDLIFLIYLRVVIYFQYRRKLTGSV